MVDQLKQAGPHLMIAVVVIVAMLILALKGSITGSEAVTVIIGIGGFSAGGAIGSQSSSGTTATQTLQVPVKATVTTPSQSSSTPATKPDEAPLT